MQGAQKCRWGSLSNGHAHFLGLEISISAPECRRELIMGSKEAEAPRLYNLYEQTYTPKPLLFQIFKKN